MITKPSTDQLRSLVRLEENEDFKVIVKWLGEALSDIDVSLRSELNEVQFRRQQGASQVLHSFLEHVAGADEALLKLNSRKP